MQPRHFETFSQLLYKNSGLLLHPEKSYLLETRLESVARKWDFDTIEGFAEALARRPSAAQIRDLVEAMATHESSFFRDSSPFATLRETIIPALIRQRGAARRLRIWSAACSAGQELYSIAMVLDEVAGAMPGWEIELLGTDLSSGIIERARSAVYSPFEVNRGLPDEYLKRYCVSGAGKWQIAERIRKKVRFEQHNLLEDTAAFGTFDIVFCRNVLIYFDVATKTDVLHRLHEQIAPDGFLILGSTEAVYGVTERFRAAPGARGAYVKSNPLSAHA